MCIIYVSFNAGYNLSMKLFPFIWSNVYLLVWYMTMLFKFTLTTFVEVFRYNYFSIFRYFDIAFVEWYSGIERLCWSYAYFFRFFTFVFWVAACSEFCCQILKSIGFSFNNYITYATSVILAFGNSLCCVFSECKWVEYF